MSEDRKVCAKLETEILLYLSGELPAERRAACAEHLRTCRSCGVELRETRRALGLYQALPPAEIDGPRLGEILGRVFTASDATEALEDPPAPALPQRRRPGDWPRRGWSASVLRLAAAIVLLLAGLLAGRALERRESPEITMLADELRETQERLTLALLEHRSASGRLHGLELDRILSPMDERLTEALLTVLDQDPSTNVRLAVVDALYRLGDLSAIQSDLCRSLERQTSPVIQLALIDLMADMRIETAVGLLRRIAREEKNQAVAQRAHWALQELI